MIEIVVESGMKNVNWPMQIINRHETETETKQKFLKYCFLTQML
jgi:hypothetical protein